MKNRSAHNHIKRLVNQCGDAVVQTEEGITEEITRFYKNLLGSAANELPVINLTIMAAGPVLNRTDQEQLIKPITRDEIYKALTDIDDLKAPGCDGFNACFFKNAWPIIGEQVSGTIINFFKG